MTEIEKWNCGICGFDVPIGWIRCPKCDATMEVSATMHYIKELQELTKKVSDGVDQILDILTRWDSERRI